MGVRSPRRRRSARRAGAAPPGRAAAPSGGATCTCSSRSMRRSMKKPVVFASNRKCQSGSVRFPITRIRVLDVSIGSKRTAVCSSRAAWIDSYRVHSGASIAFDSPCGTWNSAPIGRLMPAACGGGGRTHTRTHAHTCTHTHTHTHTHAHTCTHTRARTVDQRDARVGEGHPRLRAREHQRLACRVVACVCASMMPGQ